MRPKEAVSFVVLANAYRLSGRCICFGNTRWRPKRTRSTG